MQQYEGETVVLQLPFSPQTFTVLNLRIGPTRISVYELKPDSVLTRPEHKKSSYVTPSGYSTTISIQNLESKTKEQKHTDLYCLHDYPMFDYFLGELILS